MSDVGKKSSKIFIRLEVSDAISCEIFDVEKACDDFVSNKEVIKVLCDITLLCAVFVICVLLEFCAEANQEFELRLRAKTHSHKRYLALNLHRKVCKIKHVGTVKAC